MSIKARRLWSVSPSAVDSYHKCARVWWNSYVLGERGPTPLFMAKGTAIHAAIEHYLKTGEVLIEIEVKDAPGIKWEVMQFVQAAIPFLPKPLTDDYWAPWREKGDASLMLEQQGELGTFEGGPNWNQFIDLIEFYPDRATVTDHKSLSDWRYMKTPDELSKNVQLVANARWLFSVSDYSEITLRHLYVNTKLKRPKAQEVTVVVSRQHVDEQWLEIMATVKEMVNWVKLNPSTPDVIPPTTTFCGSYGGCQYRAKCGFSIQDGFVSVSRVKRTTGGGEAMGSLLDQMMASAKNLGAQAPKTEEKPAEQAKPAAVAKPLTGLAALMMEKTPAPTAAPTPEPERLTPEKAQAAAVAAGYPVEPPPPVSILPPDAPSPISTPEEVAAANPPKAEKAMRGRKKASPVQESSPAQDEIKVVHTSGPTQVPATLTIKAVVDGEVVATTTTAPEVAGPNRLAQAAPAEESELDKARKLLSTPDSAFACGVEVLFIDCMPGKGWPGEQPKDLTEYLHAFNALAATSAGAVDYRLIRYESKGYLATAVRLYMKALPKAIYVDSRMGGSDVFLECVVPYVKMIFRGVR